MAAKVDQEDLNTVRAFANALRFAEKMDKALTAYLSIEEQTNELERRRVNIAASAKQAETELQASEARAKKRIAELADELALHQERNAKATDQAKRDYAEWVASFQKEREAEMEERKQALGAVEKQHEERMVRINRQFDDAVARLEELNKEIAKTENELSAAAKVKTQMKADLASLLK